MSILKETPKAMAHIRGSEAAPHLRGTVRFYPHYGHVLVEARVEGLPECSETGFFALHIHSGTSCCGADFSDTQGHFNPEHVPHPRHDGDLPPLLSCNGKAYLAVMTDRFHLRDIIGRTVVIHSGADDFCSQPAGNAGEKIACGQICACTRIK